VLCLLPGEADALATAGVAAKFVGHPAVEDGMELGLWDHTELSHAGAYACAGCRRASFHVHLRGAMPSMRTTLQDSLLSFATVANDSDNPSFAGSHAEQQ
jgi:hypothetical protein